MIKDIELLAPAANADTAIQAILHGADAVYMGGPSHGARKNAANSLDDIRRVVEFAHIFRAKVYITVNTIVFDHELPAVEKMISSLYKIGVDALIVQDMGILRLDIPPIALHASTQCDTRTPEKARFLEDVGFSQIVLARELTLKEISEVCSIVNVPVETFIHGALCVSYSGRCHASQACMGRSANRGECAQICRLPYNLYDANGHLLARDKHLLSLKDFNASDRVDELLQAGVSSFKIEGRLKDTDYVKNVTAYYRTIIDKAIALNPDMYRRSSAGESILSFTPQLDKSFNRGFSHYFLDSRRPQDISQPATPKSMGECITDINQLHNGDGISFFDSNGEYSGVMVNGIKQGKIIGNRPFFLPKGAVIHRTLDVEWSKRMASTTARRLIKVDFTLNRKSINVSDERGLSVTLSHNLTMEQARKPMDFHRIFSRLGNTNYQLRSLNVDLPELTFIPASQLADLRREALELLERSNLTTYPFDYRRKENLEAIYVSRHLDYTENVANRLAADFYRCHGVESIQPAMETASEPRSKAASAPRPKNGTVVMTTRHCILREMGCCRKQNPRKVPSLPLELHSSNLRFLLDFDCKNCEMKVMMK